VNLDLPAAELHAVRAWRDRVASTIRSVSACSVRIPSPSRPHAARGAPKAGQCFLASVAHRRGAIRAAATSRSQAQPGLAGDSGSLSNRQLGLYLRSNPCFADRTHRHASSGAAWVKYR
jgi:hypothetical protein